MDMMEETEEQTTYSLTLENLALGNGETDGETQQGSNGCYKATILRGIILLCENPE